MSSGVLAKGMGVPSRASRERKELQMTAICSVHSVLECKKKKKKKICISGASPFVLCPELN